jgi:hypothetical protein
MDNMQLVKGGPDPLTGASTCFGSNIQENVITI